MNYLKKKKLGLFTSLRVSFVIHNGNHSSTYFRGFLAMLNEMRERKSLIVPRT